MRIIAAVALFVLLVTGLLSSRGTIRAQSYRPLSQPWRCWTATASPSSALRTQPDAACIPNTPNVFPRGSAPSRNRARAIAPPGSPTSLSGAISGDTVVLTWASPATGDVPTSYVLEAGSSPGQSDLVNADTGSPATTLTATNVSPGAYFVRVRARNASGTSAPSNEIVVTISGMCGGPPGVPVSLTTSQFSPTFRGDESP
jgi:Fibronectin type III domain